MNKETPIKQIPITQDDNNSISSMDEIYSFIGLVPSTRRPTPDVVGIIGREEIQTENLPTMMNTPNNGFTVPGNIFSDAQRKPLLFSLDNNETISDLKINRGDKYNWISETKKKQEKLPHLIADYIVIGVVSEKINKKIAQVEITKDSDSGIGSINDPQMGVVPPNNICATCHLGFEECPGHYGRIRLGVPIYNPLFIKQIEYVLKCVCSDCAKLLLTEDQIKEAGLNYMEGLDRLEAMAEYCKKAKDLVCQTSRNIGQKKTCLSNIEVGPVIKCTKNPDFVSQKLERMTGKIMMKTLNNNSIQLYVEKAYCTLDMISDEDKRLMGFDEDTHPRDLIVFSILVIPPAFRSASIVVPGSYAIDRLGNIYKEIVKINNEIINLVDKKDKIEEKQRDTIEDKRDKIYAKYMSLLNENVDKSKPKKAQFTGLLSVFQTKKGILRNLALGKRVDFTARTVIGPNPFLSINQVGIPRIWRKHLTVPVTVTSFNKKSLTELLRKGEINSVIYGRGKGYRVIINEKNQDSMVLKPGHVCERWLREGDYVTLGRQPSIHKQNIMGMEVVFVDSLNIQLNKNYVEPFNADFDGDEMNIYVGQSIKARAEIEILMSLKHCLMNEQMNAPMVGLILSDVTAAYVLTSENPDISPSVWYSSMSLLQEKDQLRTLDDRLTKAGLNRKSGRALFSMLFPEDFFYQKGEVLIENGVLINGAITKADIGRSRNSLIHAFRINYGSQRTTIFLTDTSRLLNRWFSSYGFSVGLESCTHTDPRVMELKEKQMAVIKMMVMQAGAKVNDPIEEEKRQREVIAYLSKPANLSMQLLQETFSFDNALARMIISGSKGNVFNLGQIAFALGLQFTGGKPIPLSLTNQTRLLPTQDPDDPDPITYSYIKSSFSSGLTPEETFIHSIPARDTMLDTALKTADVGKMSRAINLSLADYMVNYDGTVRNANNQILQFLYGDDGLDPSNLTLLKMNGEDLPFFMNVNQTIKRLNSKYGYEPFVEYKIPEKVLKEIEPTKYVPVNNNYQIQYIINNGGVNRLIKYLGKYITYNQATKLVQQYTDDPSFYGKLVELIPKEDSEEKINRIYNRDEKRANEYKNYFSILTSIKKEFNEIDETNAYLDFGSGTAVFSGLFGRFLGFDKENIFGTDIENWRRSYKILNEDVTFVPLIIDQPLQFSNDQFTVVSAMMTLHHVRNLEFILSEFSRIIKQGGFLIIREHDADNDIDRLIIDVEHMIYDFIDEEYNDESRQLYYGKYYSKEQWNKMITSYGFKRRGDGDEFLVDEKRSETKPFYAVYEKQ